MVPLRIVRKLQDVGLECDLVLGTMTGQLGDPSGQDKTRPFLPWEDVRKNADRIAAECLRVLDRDRTTLWFNHTFVEGMSVAGFLTQLVSRFTVATLMRRDAFRQRGDTGVRMHELLVPLLQGYDSVKLGTTLEVGGNDQHFNFQITRDLQSAFDLPPEDCILTPIINGTDGRKMSKSHDNCVWLDDTPTNVFGKTMSIADAQVEQWAALLTDLDLLTLREVGPMQAKLNLSFDLTRQLHGEVEAHRALEGFQARVQGKLAPDEMPHVPPGTILSIVMALRGCSKTAAHKLLQSGAVRVAGVKVEEPSLHIPPDTVVQVGKRVWGLVLAPCV